LKDPKGKSVASYQRLYNFIKSARYKVMGVIGLTEIILIFSLYYFHWCHISILTNKFSGNEKLLWVIVVILIPLVGHFILFLEQKYNKG
jgi:hypothetical protein